MNTIMTQEQVDELMQSVKEVQQSLQTIKTQPTMPGDTILLKDFGDNYMEDKSYTVDPSSHATYYSVYKNHVRRAFGDQTLSSITREQVQTFINSMRARPYSKVQMRNVRWILSAILERAASDRIIQSNPCKDVKLPRLPEKKKRAPILSEYERLLAASRRHRLWIAVPLLFLTGMRIGEMMALTWDDIDMQKRSIRISKTYSTHNRTGCPRLKPPKTKASHRFIPIGDELYAMLKSYRATEGKGKHIVLPQKNADERTSPDTMRRIFERWGYASDMPNDITPHSGRHYFANKLYMAGMNPEMLRHLTSHSDMATLLNVYCYKENLEEKELQEARSMMDALSPKSQR